MLLRYKKTLPLLVDGSFEPFVPECGSDDVLGILA